MSPHKKIYFEAMGYTEGDFVASEVSGAAAVDIHAIECDGMGGSPSKETHRIENLIALTRKEHVMYGDKKQFKSWLYRNHLLFMESHGVKFDREYIMQQIAKND